VKVISVFIKSVFWLWNLLFASVVVFGVLPMVLLPLVIDSVTGFAPWELVGTTALLCAVPIFSVVHAAQSPELKELKPLLAFMFGVELPLLACLVARLFGMGELAGAAGFLYGAIVAGGAVAEIRVVVGERLPRHQIIDGLCHALLTLRAAVGLYVGGVLASITLPFMLSSLMAFNTSPDRLAQLFIFLVIGSWFLLSFAFVLIMPVLTPLSWLRAALLSGRELRKNFGDDDLFITSVAPVGAGVAIVVSLWPQPHTDVLTRLKTPPTTNEERAALVNDADAIKEGLVDAYLAKHRYVFDESDHPWSAVLRPFLVDGANVRSIVDAPMREVARPFFYQRDDDGYPRFGDDADKARTLYRAFFGTELEREHAAEVRTALSARWDRSQRFAGFIDEGQQRVRLEEQDVAIANTAGTFTVEVHDTWVNQTTIQQEVVLFFELPESAAVTGLWLAEHNDKSKAFTHVISPRGAAQQIYREEVRARRDPALLEQIGPRQYRLRVFPIPPRTRPQGKDTFAVGWHDDDTTRMHVWLRYEALPDAQGRPPLPLLREHRNGFWDQDTRRTLTTTAAQEQSATSVLEHGGWVQLDDDAIAGLAASRTAVQGAVHDGCVTLTPASPPSLPSLAGKTVDVVIDRSLSLAPARAQLRAAIATLRTSGARVRVVLGTSGLRGERAADVPEAAVDAAIDDIVFFGAAQPKELLTQLAGLRRGGLADVVVVLTGTASYDVADDAPLALPEPVPPVLLVHVLGALPKGYDDATLDLVRRSGGAIATDVTDALLRLEPSKSRGYVDGFAVQHTPEACAQAAAPSAIAARQRILLADRGGKADVADLDALHALAQRASVVTPYSSAIVLVDDAQRARLQALEQKTDRFEREVDDEGKLTNKGAPASESAPAPTQKADPSQPPEPAPPSVQGVPEPEEWLLIFLCLGAAGVWAWRKRGDVPFDDGALPS